MAVGTEERRRRYEPRCVRARHLYTSLPEFGFGGLEKVAVFPKQVWFVGVFNSSWLSLVFSTVWVLLEGEGCLLRQLQLPQPLNWDVCGVAVRFWDWDAGQLL